MGYNSQVIMETHLWQALQLSAKKKKKKRAIKQEWEIFSLLRRQPSLRNPLNQLVKNTAGWLGTVLHLSARCTESEQGPNISHQKWPNAAMLRWKHRKNLNICIYISLYSESGSPRRQHMSTEDSQRSYCVGKKEEHGKPQQEKHLFSMITN